MQEDLNEFYWDRIEELEEMGIEYPICEGVYSDISAYVIKSGERILVSVITNWRPSNSVAEPLCKFLPFNDLFTEPTSVEEVEDALEGATIEITKIIPHNVQIDGITITKMKIDWKYLKPSNKPINKSNNGN